MTMLMPHIRKFPKEYLEEGIHALATQYPACFFEDPRRRRPLKNSIRADLQKDGVTDELIACVNYYESNWTYQNLLQAGAERVDLNGRKVGTVTEQEQRNAQKRIRDDKERLSAENNDAISVVHSLHAAGKIPDDQLSKITVPMKPTMKSTAKPKSAPLLARLEALLASTVTISIETEDAALRTALVAASLKVLVKEAERIIASLESPPTAAVGTERSDE